METKQKIYIANCIEMGEKFVTQFKTIKTNKQELLEIGQELAQEWGGECISVTQAKPTKLVRMFELGSSKVIETTERRYNNWVKKFPISKRYDYSKTEHFLEEVDTSDIWDSDKSSEENLKDYNETLPPLEEVKATFVDLVDNKFVEVKQ